MKKIAGGFIILSLWGILHSWAIIISESGTVEQESQTPFPGFEYDPQTGTYIGEPIVSPPIEVPTMREWWENLGLTQPRQAFPLSIEVIDPEHQSCRLIFGDPEGSNVSVEVSPEGIRSPEGTLVGPDFTLEVNGQEISISVETIEENGKEAFNIIITPQSPGFPIQGQYSREFTLGHLQGEINVNGSASQPTISITLRNPNHGELEMEATPEGPSFSAQGRLDIGEEDGYGRVTGSIRIQDGRIEIDGGPTWRLTQGGYTVELKIGEYLRVTQNEQELSSSDVAEAMRARFPGMSEEERRKLLEKHLQDSVEELQQALARALRGEVVQVPDSLKFFLNLGRSSQEQQKIMEAVLPIIMGRTALELSAEPDMREAKLVFTLADAEDENGNPKVIYGIGIRDTNGEIKGIFSATDSTGRTALEIVHSFTQGLQRVMLQSGGLEMVFTPQGWEVGSAQGGGDLLSRMRAITQPGFGWRYSYSRTDGWALELSYTVPYKDSEDSKEDKDHPRTLRSFVIVGPQGLQDLGIRLPLGGGILELTLEGASYEVERRGLMFRGTVGGGGFEIEFAIPIGEPENGGSSKNILN